jgi:hypothetical protein
MRADMPPKLIRACSSKIEQVHANPEVNIEIHDLDCPKLSGPYDARAGGAGADQ